MHVAGLPLPYFDRKKSNDLIKNFFYQNMMGKIWDTHKRTFQDLKGTIMHVSSLTSPYFDKKSTIFTISCFYPNMVRKNLRHPLTCVLGPETHVYACCRSSPTLFWFKNQLVKYLILNRILVGKTWDMHKRALKGLKRPLMHVSGQEHVKNIF